MFRWAAWTLSLILCIEWAGANSNITTDEPGGIKLVEWKFNKFANYFRMILALIAMCLFKMYYRRIPFVPNYLPESMLLIVIGVSFGAVFSATSKQPLSSTLWKLTPEVFFEYLLPPIILDAAYSLFNRTFLDHLGSILVYAVVGTVLNYFIIGPMMFGLHQAGAFGLDAPDISLNSFFLFASLIVAVDPVAVLAIFQDIGVNPGLYYMVFGESLLNDAVTVVLYKIMTEFVNVEMVTGADIGLGIASFFTISFGGLFVGVVLGVFSSFFTRWQSHFAPVFLILVAYFSYILGDCLGWSGIIAMIGCGLVHADYAFHNIDSSQRTILRGVIKQMAEVSESFIFLLIGIQLFSSEIKWHTGFCLWGLVSCLVARTIIVILLSWLINRFNVNNVEISKRQQVIIIYGGLRGAVALCLAVLVESDELGKQGVAVRRMIVTTTLFIILVTVGLMGTTIKPLVNFFHVKLAGMKSLSMWVDMNRTMMDHGLSGIEAIVGSTGRNQLRDFFARLDDRFIRPLLQRDPETHDEKILKTYEKIALKLHFATINPSKLSTYLAELPEPLKRQHIKYQSQLHLQSLEENTTSQNINAFMCTANDEQDEVPTLEVVNSDVLYPNWRRHTSQIDHSSGQEDFHGTLMSFMRRKSFFLSKSSPESENTVYSRSAENTVLRRDSTKPKYTDFTSDEPL